MLGLDHTKRLKALMQQAASRHGLFDVFRDFCEMSAISISNAVDWGQRDAREERYLQIIRQYEPATQQLFPQMLGELVECLEAGPDDVLGRVFMEMELSNKWSGQFFTPMPLCETMAMMTVLPGLEALLQQQPFITVHEPAVGGGATIMGLCKALAHAGHNYQQVMHVTAVDIDIRCVHMAYLQCSLLHIPAVIIHGDTLRMEMRSSWYTPAHILNGWNWKLRRREDGNTVALSCPETPVAAPVEEDAVLLVQAAAQGADVQLVLF